MLKDYSEQVLKKTHAQEVKISGEKINPHNSLVAIAQKDLEEIYSGAGRVNPKYAKETLIALEHAKNHHHYITCNSMLEDINAGLPIVFNNYK